MTSSARTRAALAALLVILPCVLLFFYQSIIRHALDLPGAWALLSQPIATFDEKGKKHLEQSLARPVVSMPAKISSGRIADPILEPVIDRQEPKKETSDDVSLKSSTVKKAASDISVTVTSDERGKSVENSIRKETREKLHAGIEQEGQLVPALTLKMSEEEVKHLLRNRQAYLVVTVDRQRYLLTVTDQQNPFHHIVVNHLTNQPGLSERYLPLPRAQLQVKDLNRLDNQVAKRIGFDSDPRYSLVFSERFNSRLTRAQLTKIQEERVNLSEMYSKGIPVTMNGRLTVVGKSIKITFFPIKTERKKR